MSASYKIPKCRTIARWDPQGLKPHAFGSNGFSPQSRLVEVLGETLLRLVAEQLFTGLPQSCGFAQGLEWH